MGSIGPPDIPNLPAKGVPYYTPAQNPIAGTAINPQPDGAAIPKLFTPITIRGATFQNRIFVSPMAQYSADNGHLTDYHLAHIGGITQRGPGLTIIEATSVLPNGRCSPEDSGLWTDSQIAPLKRVIDFGHSQGQKIGIQLTHSGRKSSTVAPWLSMKNVATKAVGGFPDEVWGPTTVPYSEWTPLPHEMTLAEITEFKTAWGAAVKRAVAAGVDVIDIHAAHGYLLSSFNSPASNARTDQYGGSFENRTRLTREIVQVTRRAMPADMPLFLRISATDWLEEVASIDESWTVESTIKFAPTLASLGVDLLDVSSGGVHPLQQIRTGPAFQAPFAKAIKAAVGETLLVSAVGVIYTAKLANSLLEDEPGLDVIMVGRMFQKNPSLVWYWADDLGIKTRHAHQIRWGFEGRGQSLKMSSKDTTG